MRHVTNVAFFMHLGTAAALAAGLLAGAGAAGAARGRAPASCCYLLEVHAQGQFSIDYGKKMDGDYPTGDGRQKHGTYSLGWRWRTAMVVRYSRSKGLVPAGDGVVAADLTEKHAVYDVLRRTSSPYWFYDTPESCQKGPDEYHTPHRGWIRASASSRLVHLSGRDFTFGPGRVAGRLAAGNCPQVDGPDSHGLAGGPTQALPVSPHTVRTKLAGMTANGDNLHLGCYRAVAVDHSAPTQHRYEGDVEVSLAFHRIARANVDPFERLVVQARAGGKATFTSPALTELRKEARAAQGYGGDEDCSWTR